MIGGFFITTLLCSYICVIAGQEQTPQQEAGVAGITVVVPIDYGSNWALTNVSPAAVMTLEAAAAYVNKQPDGACVIAYCNADLPHLGMQQEDSARWKQAILATALRGRVPRFEVPAKVSVDEAQNIHDKIAEQGIEVAKVILFCDRWHARRLRIIWRHVFGNTPIEIHKVRCRWGGGEYALSYMMSEWAWIKHNLKGFLALRFLGIKGAAALGRRIQQK